MPINKTFVIFFLFIISNYGIMRSQKIVINPIKRIELLIQMNEFDKAIEFTNSLDDSLFCAKNEILGFTYSRLGNYEMSIKHYENYIKECNPSYIQRINLGDSYFKVDSISLARKQFLKILETNPDYSLAHYNLGQIEYKLGNKKKAAIHFSAALDNTGEVVDFDYVEVLIQTYLDMEEYENALKVAEEVTSIWKDHTQTDEYKYSSILKSMITGEMGQYKKAIAEIDKILETNIENQAILLEAYSNKLKFYFKLNDTKNACKEFEKIKELNPEAEILNKYNCE